MFTAKLERDLNELVDIMERDDSDRNRRNAQKSTGPKTLEGKARSRMNALRHGLCATVVLVLPEEDAAAFERLRKGIHDSFKPADVAEEVLVDQYVSTSWKLRRVGDAEAAANEREMGRSQPRTIAGQILSEASDEFASNKARLNLMNLEDRLQRMLGRTLKQIRELRQLRQAQRDAEEPAAEAAAVAPTTAQPVEQGTVEQAESTVQRPEMRASVQESTVLQNEAGNVVGIASPAVEKAQNEPTAPLVEPRIRTAREIAGY